MQNRLSIVLDECLARIKSGESVRVCLSAYPELQHKLVPLLHTAVTIETAPRASPSDEFRRMSRSRLLTRLIGEPARTAELQEDLSVFDRLGALWSVFGKAPFQLARVAIPLVLVIMIFSVGLSNLGLDNFISPSPALGSSCTLTTLSGNVEWQEPSSGTWETAENGMILRTGAQVRTASDAHAVLTFFNGTAVKLDPGTVLTVEQLENGRENQSPAVVLNQWVGRTWSRVQKMVDRKPYYEIQTPSAAAIVRGTIFITEVDEIGATKVHTIEGLVGVDSQGEEVFVSAGKQTTVEPGASPSEPVPVIYSEIDIAVDIEKFDEQLPEKGTITEPSVTITEPAVTAEEPIVTAVEPAVTDEEPVKTATEPATATKETGDTAKEDAGVGEVEQLQPEKEAPEVDEVSVSWQGKYSQWLILIVIGSILFSFGITMILRKRI